MRGAASLACLTSCEGLDPAVPVFSLDLPWWEFALRGAITYGALLVLVRISGKRTVGQFTPFDLIVVRYAFLETDGTISIQKKQEGKPT